MRSSSCPHGNCGVPIGETHSGRPFWCFGLSDAGERMKGQDHSLA